MTGPTSTPRLYLTERDLHMLFSLSQARYLTAEELEWLHLLPHQAAVGRVYAAIRGRILERPDLEFTDWLSEHDFQRDHDRIAVYTPQGEEGGYHEQGIQPDSAFFVEHEDGRSLFFVEIERDQPIRKWKRKVWSYEAYHGSRQLQTRFGHPTFTLLGVAETVTQQRNLLQATAEALVARYPYDTARREQARERYVVTTLERAHPATIGRGWQELLKVKPLERKAIGGGMRYRAEIETGEFVLIKQEAR